MVHLRKKFIIFLPGNSSWAEMFWTFGENKSNSVVKIALYVSRGHFVERFLRTFYFSITFRHWTKTFWTLDGKCFPRGSGTAFYMSRQGFIEFFSPKNCIGCLCFLGFDWELFELFSKDSRNVPWKDLLYVQNNNLRKLAFWNYSLVFVSFGLSSKKNRMICKSLNRVVIAAFHTSGGTLCRQKVFFEKKLFSSDF